MEKKRTTPTPAMKKKLQAEIDSKCPFCDNLDVEIFEFHHIDGDRSNTIAPNLIMICPNCHSKIDKAIITTEQVKNKKYDLLYNK